MQTSYERVWATARCPPKTAYFLLDPHLIAISPYTVRPITANNKIIFKFLASIWYTNSNQVQDISIRVILTVGPARNRFCLTIEILENSFVNSFVASAIG